MPRRSIKKKLSRCKKGYKKTKNPKRKNSYKCVRKYTRYSKFGGPIGVGAGF